MELQELPDVLERELDYPISASTVDEQIGDTELDAPDASDTLTIRELLAYVSDQTFESADELYETIEGNLPEEYIGRKGYSDRGGNVDSEASAPPDDRENESL